jgi:hypothetical protein
VHVVRDAAGAQLDRATLTVTGRLDRSRSQRVADELAPFITTAYPDCGEGTAIWRAPGGSTYRGKRGEAADPERAEREAARRARATLRRWCVANQCDRLGTLTFAPEYLPADRAGVWRVVARFRRRMAEVDPDLVMAVTIEGDPGVEQGGEDGKRLHVHIAFNRYVRQDVVERAWGVGFVDLRKIRTAGEGKRARARRAAGYLAKYVGKEFGAGAGGRGLNGRRHSVTKGHAVRWVQRRLSELPEVLQWVHDRCGGPVSGAWSSASAEGWRGPPIWVWEFGDP